MIYNANGFECPDNVAWAYRPAWRTEWTPCEIVKVKNPGGKIDRIFGGHSPVYTIKVPGELPFATDANSIRKV